MKSSLAASPARQRLIIVTILLALAVLAAALTGGSARASSSRSFHWSGGTRPVIVLEHGAWADSSSWNGEIRLLQHDGFTVYAPPNPLRGLSYDSAYLHDFLTENPALQGKPVVLVGHSYGGAVITNAAVGDPEVKALVYVDAFIPAEGESIGELLNAQPGSCLGGNPASVFDLVPYPGGPAGDVDTYIKPSVFPGCFASGLPAGLAARLAATQQPLAASAVTEPSGPPAWLTIPSWAVIGTADRVIPPAELQLMATRAGAHITYVDAGHLSLISDPGAVTRVIIDAAIATS
ncbi:MAG TPA: alpha/beta hydrolase [Streptosporangiaceae bacterium]|nr:alpha/beta hydrolase [Streptosporangiaceae bacterium]